MFKSRVALAATLSSNYGIYNGFELLEHEPIPGREEYLNSEKYEIKVRDWNKPGNIKDYIGRLNRLRRENARAAADRRPALRAGRRRRGDRLRQGIGRARQRRRRRDRADRHEPRRFWFHFGDLTIGPDGDRKPVRAIVESRHRRAPRHRMGRRAADASIPPAIPRCCSAARPEGRRAVNIAAANRRAAGGPERPLVQGRHHLSAARQGVRRQQQ